MTASGAEQEQTWCTGACWPHAPLDEACDYCARSAKTASVSPPQKWDRCSSCDAGTFLRWSCDHDAWFCWSCWQREVTPASGDPCTEACPAHDPHEFADDADANNDVSATTASVTPLEVVTAWFAADLTWHSFQAMTDEDMAEAVLAALAEAGYAVVASGDEGTSGGVA